MANNIYFKNNVLIKDDKVYGIDTANYVINKLSDFLAYFGTLGLSNKTPLNKTPGLLNNGFTTENNNGVYSVYLSRGKYLIKNSYDENGDVVPYELYNRIVITSGVEIICEKDVVILYKTPYASFTGLNETNIVPYEMSTNKIYINEKDAYNVDPYSERQGDYLYLENATSVALYDDVEVTNNYVDNVTSIVKSVNPNIVNSVTPVGTNPAFFDFEGYVYCASLSGGNIVFNKYKVGALGLEIDSTFTQQTVQSTVGAATKIRLYMYRDGSNDIKTFITFFSNGNLLKYRYDSNFGNSWAGPTLQITNQDVTGAELIEICANHTNNDLYVYTRNVQYSGSNNDPKIHLLQYSFPYTSISLPTSITDAGGNSLRISIKNFNNKIFISYSDGALFSPSLRILEDGVDKSPTPTPTCGEFSDFYTYSDSGNSTPNKIGLVFTNMGTATVEYSESSVSNFSTASHVCDIPFSTNDLKAYTNYSNVFGDNNLINVLLPLNSNMTYATRTNNTWFASTLDASYVYDRAIYASNDYVYLTEGLHIDKYNYNNIITLAHNVKEPTSTSLSITHDYSKNVTLDLKIKSGDGVDVWDAVNLENVVNYDCTVVEE